MSDKPQIEAPFDKFEDSSISFTNLLLLGEGAEEDTIEDEDTGFTQIDHLEIPELNQFSQSCIIGNSKLSFRRISLAIRNSIAGKF